jgi:hypothetical protein
MTSIPCTACGVIDTPCIEPGTGPHVAKALCRGCGRFLKWLPKVLVGKEVRCMQASINRVILLGAIGRHGVEVSYYGQGTAKASFILVVSEMGTDGKEHQLWQPVEIWGKRAEQVGELDAGATVLVEGRLRRIKRGENWETVVSGWDCTPLQVPVVPAAVGATI